MSLVFVFGGCGTFAADPPTKGEFKLEIRERSLGKVPSDYIANISISPDARHVGYIMRQDGKFIVVLDGIAQRAFEYVERESVVFSPNGNRVAYKARVGDKWFVVLDGVQQTAYDGLKESEIVFSPDSKRVGYVAKRGKKELVVVDGNESKEYGWANRPVFSPDSKRVAFSAGYQIGERWKNVAVVDGTEGKPYDGVDNPIFSADSKHVAYVIGRAGHPSRVVVDEVEGRGYDWIPDNGCTFSPDGTRIAYEAVRGSHQLAVVNEEEGKEYEVVDCPIFSPDGKRVAYSVINEGKRFVVVDGVEGEKFDSSEWIHAFFSPDGKVCYLAKTREGSWVVVWENTKSEPYWEIIQPPVFNFDGKKMAYAACLDGQNFVFVRGNEDKKFAVGEKGEKNPFAGDKGLPDIRNLTFTPDGKRVVYSAASGYQWAFVVNGSASRLYQWISSSIVFEGPTAFHSIAARDGELFCVEIEIIEK